MSTEPDFRLLIDAATGRRGVAPLLAALGVQPCMNLVPRSAWSGYGLAEVADVRALLVAGGAGSLDALLVEVAAECTPQRAHSIARRVRARNPARVHLYLVVGPEYARLTLGIFGLDDTFHHLTIERGRLRRSDIDALNEMVPRGGERGLELAVRHARALDRSRITGRFFRDFRARRTAIAAAWTGVPPEAVDERSQLALLFLSRLTFLYFLQRRGALADNDQYLVELYGRWAGAADGSGQTFYRARLVPLFFGALNRRPDERDAAARELGKLPYLNGGLFERHAMERRAPDLDLPDTEVASCFDHLLERYRFTGREAGAGAGHGVDPEILGRVFEELMAPDERGDTGSFYTPAPVVGRVVREAVATYLAASCTPEEATAVVEGQAHGLPADTRYRARRALERIRILDPACGSGAFLLGALHHVAASLDGLTDRPAGEVRRQVVARSLHGVDLLDDAALLCSLRLWLALAEDDDEIRPLPNLDRRIRQGDALVDPLDLTASGDGAAWHPLHEAPIRRALRAVGPAARRYLDSGPEERHALRDQLERAEARLARRWMDGALQASRRQLRRLRARAADRDLFGDVPDAARDAAGEADRVNRRVRELDRLASDLTDTGALPFFSFGVHFADAARGFDLIICNPPWVRSHRWPDHLRRLSGRYEVSRDAGWKRATALTGATGGAGAQVDLSLLFVERALRLLAPGGILAVLIPAKALRALYGGGARRMLLRDLDFALIEDHALDQRSIFRADAFTAVLVGRKRATPAAARTEETGGSGVAHAEGPRLHVRLIRRHVKPLEYRIHQRDLPLLPSDPASPWLMAPPDVVEVFRRMQQVGPPLGRHAGCRVRRGVMTGANDTLLFSKVEPKIGGLAYVEAEGYRRSKRRGQDLSETERYRAMVEMAGLRRLVRGADIDAFRYGTNACIAWCHDEQAGHVEPPSRLRRYLEGHRRRLEERAGWRLGMPLGVVFRLSRDTLAPKVAWHDLSDTLRAVALPATVRMDGQDRELIPLNTVYFLPTPDDRAAVLLAGLLNSLPIRTMARAMAERAKDARFRFFAWTVSALPVPPSWQESPVAEEIGALSQSAHDKGGLDARDAARLDMAVARLYGLTSPDMAALRRFDAWLRGEP